MFAVPSALHSRKRCRSPAVFEAVSAVKAGALERFRELLRNRAPQRNRDGVADLTGDCRLGSYEAVFFGETLKNGRLAVCDGSRGNGV